MRTKLVIGMLLLWGSACATPTLRAMPRLAGTQSQSEPLTLTQALHAVSESSPGALAARAEYRAKVDATGVAGALPNPNVAYTYFVEPIQTRAGDQTHRVDVTQVVPSVFALHAASEAAEQSAVQSGFEYDHQIAALHGQVHVL